jgi:hypothetical protein
VGCQVYKIKLQSIVSIILKCSHNCKIHYQKRERFVGFEALKAVLTPCSPLKVKCQKSIGCERSLCPMSETMAIHYVLRASQWGLTCCHTFPFCFSHKPKFRSAGCTTCQLFPHRFLALHSLRSCMWRRQILLKRRLALRDYTESYPRRQYFSRNASFSLRYDYVYSAELTSIRPDAIFGYQCSNMALTCTKLYTDCSILADRYERSLQTTRRHIPPSNEHFKHDSTPNDFRSIPVFETETGTSATGTTKY